MDEMIRFEMTRDQALTALGAAELCRARAEEDLAQGNPETEDAAAIAMGQFDDVAKLLRLVLFG